MSREKRIEKAARRYKRFHGRDPDKVKIRRVKFPDTVLHVGECSGILYITPDGEQFIHRFRGRSRPQLAASQDGKILVLLGGAFQFTDRGIVDR